MSLGSRSNDESPGEEDELFGETEDDLANLSADTTFDAVVVSSDWTTETILSQIQRGKLELDPVFQRRDAWDRRKKSRFIESLAVGLPVPQVVLAERKGRRGEFLVLDGKQRLLSIDQYFRGDFRLSGLELRADLNGKGLGDLPEDDRQALETQTIRTVVVRNWQREEFLYLVFLRLNTANVPLSPQELRQALHPGPFVSFVNDFTLEYPEFGLALRRRPAPDFRMRDVELLVRHFAFTRFLPEYNGNLKDLLDATCLTLNSQMTESEDSRSEVSRDAEACVEAIRSIFSAFGTDAFRRWNRTRFEAPFNRAVFDIMTFYARRADVRRFFEESPAEAVDAFKKLCGVPDFQSSLTTTTKSTDAIFIRLRMWGERLTEISGLRLPLPVRTLGGRIGYAAL